MTERDRILLLLSDEELLLWHRLFGECPTRNQMQQERLRMAMEREASKLKGDERRKDAGAA